MISELQKIRESAVQLVKAIDEFAKKHDEQVAKQNVDDFTKKSDNQVVEKSKIEVDNNIPTLNDFLNSHYNEMGNNPGYIRPESELIKEYNELYRKKDDTPQYIKDGYDNYNDWKIDQEIRSWGRSPDEIDPNIPSLNDFLEAHYDGMGNNPGYIRPKSELIEEYNKLYGKKDDTPQYIKDGYDNYNDWELTQEMRSWGRNGR